MKALIIFVISLSSITIGVAQQAIDTQSVAGGQPAEKSHVVMAKGTPSRLVEAIEAGDLARLQALLASGVDANELHYEFETPLIVSARDGYNAAVRLLLEANARVDYQSARGWTALMWAGQKGRVETIRTLLAAGADVNLQNSDRETALLWAARDGNLESVELLMAAGADTRIRDERGRNAFLMAAEGGKEQTVEKFLALGEKPSFAEQYTALLMATHSADTVRVLLRTGAFVDVMPYPFLLSAALYGAAGNGRAETVQVLIEAGADVNVRDSYGRSPLSRALVKNDTAVVEVLRAAGAVE